MLIEKITLRNFRVYHGEHTVSLSINPEQNVSIISGQNGFGKTSLLTSLVWGLYGKLIPDVDDRYRKEIYESGGYKKYASKLFNRYALQHANEEYEKLKRRLIDTTDVLERERVKQNIDDIYSFSISVQFTNISIPHISCNNLVIKRTYNIKSETEDIQILIDGRTNELTKTIGQEIFINDFILPKEVAKFFFFDAEKITALAEISNLEEKQYFSKAYNEVLGIKKYVDLKHNLENLLLRIKKRSAQKGDLQKIDTLQKKVTENNDLLTIYKQDLSRKEQDQIVKKSDFSQIQEQLVRLGSALSHDELQEFKRMRSQLKDEIAKNKNQFNDLLELAPFAMIADKILQVNKQLKIEEIQQNIDLVNSLLQEKYVSIKKAFVELKNIDLSVVETILSENLLPSQMSDQKVLFDFTIEQRNQFKAVFDNLKNAYSKSFKTLVANSKRLQSTYNILQKKVQDAEVKDSDPVIKALRHRFETLNIEIRELEEKILNLKVKITVLEKDISTINRQLSEQTKNIRVEATDRQKAETTGRLLSQLDNFIKQLKQKKRISLQKSIKNELNRLMHKHDFVKQVNVIIEGDLIDIDLLDMQDQKINKDSLSKGEQQLYATALLKALVSESNIQFPVFIDSPLQKFDKLHAANIIKDFYPVISSQVVLFPLLEKELNETEYNLLLPKVGKAYLIEQIASYRSAFNEVVPKELFSNYQQMYSRYV
ncbi:AAA family ATPase [Mucilaginibacter xinganensis]|uniref:DNA sulfur modification protein DndD n=1 Tax=Mucilaginibacter xinganensis TaxID=1234841 RepID=A0A223NWK5_9SPHI|nr:AAA family ATPase [Mucilaginibacter xinganensis]ASU34253.1 DNA sulfur modification protein DndD [Mucilaginibacter xinganensis]